MRSRTTWIGCVAVALLLSACSDTGQHGRKGPKPFTEFDAVTVEQSDCFQPGCPVFEVRIFADGRVRHSGPSFDESGGPHESRVDRRGLESIARALRVARIDEMRDRYLYDDDVCQLSVNHMFILEISVTRANGYRNKSVRLYTGCIGPQVPTERITALLDAVDRVTGTDALLAQRKQSRARHGESAAGIR